MASKASEPSVLIVGNIRKKLIIPITPIKTIKNPDRIAKGNPIATASSPTNFIWPKRPPTTLHATKNNTPKIGVIGDQKYDQNFFNAKATDSLKPIFLSLANSKAANRVIEPAKIDQIINNPKTKTTRTVYSCQSTDFIDSKKTLRKLHKPSLGETITPLIKSNGVIVTNFIAEAKARITKTQITLTIIPTKAETSLLKSSVILKPRIIS